MIIPVKCFTCGMVLADKYRFYQTEVRKRKLANKSSKDDNYENIDKVMYLTKEFHEKTPEGEVLDELNLRKMCCRRHMLTHVDIE
jgi:DNA-directed RNA polymerase subunit N (RpoN/RPB10)